MKKGYFITFEGPDGSGKSTIVSQVSDFLKQNIDTDVVVTREPGGTNNIIAEDIRNILLNKLTYKIDYRAEALLFAASRAQHVADFILPNLKENKIVLCDRYIHSSLVYQGCVRGLGYDNVLKINEFAMHGVFPNLTILIMVRPEVGLNRINSNSNREINRLDKESIEMHTKVCDSFKEIVKKNNCIIVVDGEKPIDEVVREVINIVTSKLKENGFIR